TWSFCEHEGTRSEQRVWNRQPEGGLIGLGTSPSRMIRLRLMVGSGIGTAESSASVYGCFGLVYSSLAGAISTILPRYITATRVEMCSTTDRSWAMNRYVSFSSSCRSSSRLTTCACTETSSADT